MNWVTTLRTSEDENYTLNERIGKLHSKRVKLTGVIIDSKVLFDSYNAHSNFSTLIFKFKDGNLQSYLSNEILSKLTVVFKY